MRLGLRLAFVPFATIAVLSTSVESSEAARCSAPASDAAKHSAWQKYRARYPHLLQGVAITRNADAPGCVLLVIAEPPPHVRVHELIAETGALEDEANVFLGKNPSGRDGWTKDVVLTIDGSVRDELSNRIASLHQYIFGTSYRAWTIDLDSPAGGAPPTADVNVNVTTGDLKSWLLDRSLKFSPLLGGRDVVAKNLAKAATRSGVYVGNGPFIAWVMPVGERMDAQLVAARQFTMESDLVIGGFVSDDKLVVIGRKRVASYDQLPPLRVETIALVAKATDALGQSYERGSPLAGLRAAGSQTPEAWAPIFLSPELKDTEFGHLLNLTDQLLKSWSNAGETRYGGFTYPDPKTWPFGKKSVIQHLNVSSLVYNWNTNDFLDASLTGPLAVISFTQTGSLPVTYIPNDAETTQSIKASKAAQQYFGEVGDSYLARVVQYTALFELFKISEKISSAKYASFASTSLSTAWWRTQLDSATQTATERHVEDTTRSMLTKFAAASDAEVQAAATRIFAMFHGHASGDVAEQKKKWLDAMAMLHSKFKGASPDALRVAAKFWVKPPLKLTADQTSLQLLLTYSKPLMHALIDIEQARTKYSQLEETQNSRWSHTPTWVASVNDFDAEGGHNIDFTWRLKKFEKPTQWQSALGVPAEALELTAEPLSAWSSSAKSANRRLQQYRGTNKVDVVRVERTTDGYSVSFEDRAQVFKVSTVADAGDLIASVTATQKDLTRPVRLHLETFTADEGRAFASSARRVMSRRRQSRPVETVTLGATSTAKHLHELRSLKEFELGAVKATDTTMEVQVSTGRGTLKRVWLAVKLRFQTTISGPIRARAEQILTATVQKALKLLGRKASFTDAARALHRDLDAALRAEGIPATPEIVDEAFDIWYVELLSAAISQGRNV